MIKSLFVVICFVFGMINLSAGQNLNLDEYDIYIGDTIISKSDFISNSKQLDSTRLRMLTFKPIKDGQKEIYYLNGQLSGKGLIKNKKEHGYWTYWHKSGQKAREGSFDEGKSSGKHTYWYSNGNLRGIGNFKNDKYDGKWTMYKEDGSETIEQFYKNGKLVE